jgi:hypothetical protein
MKTSFLKLLTRLNQIILNEFDQKLVTQTKSDLLIEGDKFFELMLEFIALMFWKLVKSPFCLLNMRGCC